MADSSEAARFKAEGNTLFQKQQFAAAYEKYTQAIKHDNQNAILFSNRAACSLGLGRYLEAHTDATQATKLDSTYAKAWARLASACAGLGKVEETINMWKRALAALPIENLSSAEQKQKEQYTSELAAAVMRKGKGNTPTPGGPVHMRGLKGEDRPWNRAAAMVPSLYSSKTWNSSAWVIAHAYQEWATGVEMMKQLRSMATPAGMGYFGNFGTIMTLSNALISDTRAFVITEQDFFDRYNKQMLFEVSKARPWTDGGSRLVMEEAPKRLARAGWDDVRPALALTVRGWIMRAFIQEHLSPDGTKVALDFYTSALEVLQWGNVQWKDVSPENKGATFKDSFVRGVKVLRLDAFLKAYTENPGPASKYPLSEVLAGAQDLMNEVAPIADDPPTDESYYSFHLSFIRYPLAKAHSAVGFYHQHTARNIRNVQGPVTEVVEHFKAAAKAYTQSAEIYPQDDEAHVSCLHCALDALLEAGGPAREVIALMDRIHEAIPVMKRIWEFSADSVSGRDKELTSDMDLRDRLLRHMQDGSLLAEDAVSRKYL